MFVYVGMVQGFDIVGIEGVGCDVWMLVGVQSLLGFIQVDLFFLNWCFLVGVVQYQVEGVVGELVDVVGVDVVVSVFGVCSFVE